MANEYFKNKRNLINSREFIRKTLMDTLDTAKFNASLITTGCIPPEFSGMIFVIQLYSIYFHTCYNALNIFFKKENKEYLKLIEKYNTFINEIAELFRSFGELDIYEINVLYNILLYQGTFSKTDTFSYYKYAIDNAEIETLGSRVTSGTGVCRHISANLLDIYKKLGYKGFEIECSNSWKKIRIHPNHQIIGVYDKNTLLISDPTNEYIGYFSTDSTQTIIMSPINNMNLKIEYYVPILEYLLNYDEHRKMVKAHNIPSYIEEKGIEEMTKSFDKIYTLVEQNKLAVQKWKEKNFVLIQEISQLEKQITDYRDQPTRKLNR